MRASWSAFQASVVRFLDHHVRSVLVGRVIQQTSDVVDEQWIQEICDLLLVCKLQRTFEGNPAEWVRQNRH